MRTKKLPWSYLAVCWILCISIVLILVLPVSAATQGGSQSIETLQQQQQVMKQQRADLIQERDRLTNLQQAAQDHLTNLQQNLQMTDTQIQDSELRLQVANQHLQQLVNDLVAARNSYQKRQAATVARLRLLQRSRSHQGWAVLLQSQSLNDFLDRRRQLQLVYKSDEQVLTKLTALANRINKKTTAVEQQKNEIDLIRQQLLSQKADYQAAAELQEQVIGRLNSDRFALEAAQTQLDKDSQAIAVLIKQKVEQAKAIDKTIDVHGTGVFAYPSDAPTSSPFGWRMHPILGYRRFHSGLDFAASYGTTIRAADSGTVIFAGWYGGYGKAVIINHGKGVTTLYGHTSELYVVEGQTVKRGQAIAAVGSTGLSTGPHLHFEVRRDGTPVDPMAFL